MRRRLLLVLQRRRRRPAQALPAIKNELYNRIVQRFPQTPRRRSRRRRLPIDPTDPTDPVDPIDPVASTGTRHNFPKRAQRKLASSIAKKPRFPPYSPTTVTKRSKHMV